MAKRLQYKRLALLALILALGFAGLGYRLVELQVLRHEELGIKSQENTQREVLLEPRRGDILDARGNLLATSISVKMVCADPALIGNRQAEVARVLSPLLQISEEKLAQSLVPRLLRNEKGETFTNHYHYVCLKKKVPLETWEKIQSAMTNLSFGLDEKKLPKTERGFYRNLRQQAIFARDEQLRVYPNQALAAHVLGYTVAEESEVSGTPVSTINGKDGIERVLDSKLVGVRGWRLTETDRQRRELITLREQDVEPRDGLNVVLTIDSVIQHIVESALAEAMEQHSPISISGVVVRPRTGEILALATLPNFDPNNPNHASADALRNRVIADIAEPGSTFKIVVAAGALNEGVVRLTDTFDCEHGHFFYAGSPLHDHEAYGTLSVQGILTKSSNIGAAKIGIRMGESRLYNYICDFGFGTATGLPLPGEVSARLFVPPVRKWSKVSIARIPMGQGISVTRLQMLMAMSAIANKGCLMRPMLVQRLEDRDHNVVANYSPQRVRQVISESTSKLMVQALKTVVSPEGTAPKAALTHYTVAGKTGTANKVENGVYVNKYFSSFIGFFPADNPELCISVTMDEPKQGGYYGGQIAAPVFKQIAERTATYLNIRPEDGEQPAHPDTLVAPSDHRPLQTAAARSQ
ncbi:MAG TPA: penicillin-binding protein 2 [Candidatus Binatia bacterium]|jgi:cell division protein FtsI/penicillin-binding protein 2|nr:penicillin-binding protein 2 [Candidatus Binatia bacterium]